MDTQRQQYRAGIQQRTYENMSTSQREGPQEKPDLPTASSWTSSLQNSEEIKFCCLSHPVGGILFMAGLGKYYIRVHHEYTVTPQSQKTLLVSLLYPYKKSLALWGSCHQRSYHFTHIHTRTHTHLLDIPLNSWLTLKSGFPANLPLHPNVFNILEDSSIHVTHPFSTPPVGSFDPTLTSHLHFICMVLFCTGLTQTALSPKSLNQTFYLLWTQTPHTSQLFLNYSHHVSSLVLLILPTHSELTYILLIYYPSV